LPEEIMSGCSSKRKKKKRTIEEKGIEANAKDKLCCVKTIYLDEASE
jgi:hypothetical protein